MKREINWQQIQDETLAHTKAALEYMAKFGIVPEGRIELFRSPETRQKEIDRIPYEHKTKQLVVYETEPGEFSAQCPFSGLPDYGTLRIEYIPEKWFLELKSLKYYITSWRMIGAAQEDITAIIYEDIKNHLGSPKHLIVETVYNVRGGIKTTCKAG